MAWTRSQPRTRDDTSVRYGQLLSGNNANIFLYYRAGVNSALGLEFIANSNSGIELELPSLELELNYHHWNRN